MGKVPVASVQMTVDGDVTCHWLDKNASELEFATPKRGIREGTVSHTLKIRMSSNSLYLEYGRGPLSKVVCLLSLAKYSPHYEIVGACAFLSMLK